MKVSFCAPFLSVYSSNTPLLTFNFIELDAYFEKVPLFVPGSGIELRDPAAREKELREGKVVVGGVLEDVKEVREKDSGEV